MQNSKRGCFVAFKTNIEEKIEITLDTSYEGWEDVKNSITDNLIAELTYEIKHPIKEIEKKLCEAFKLKFKSKIKKKFNFNISY